jgi:hypothetical protein
MKNGLVIDQNVRGINLKVLVKLYKIEVNIKLLKGIIC